jgi:hypothetical protein
MLVKVGCKVGDLYTANPKVHERVSKMVDDTLIARLADGVAGQLGGKTGIAPRIFLKKLIADLLDIVDLNADYDPGKHYTLTIREDELSDEERNSVAADGVEDIKLDL